MKMNRFIKNIIFLVSIFFIISCDDPAPIEVANEEEEIEISVVNPEPSTYTITGYDSTGSVNSIPEQETVILLNGIKNTIDNTTFYKAYGEAIFFDKTLPVFNNNNRLLGYRTRDIRSVKFGNKLAQKVPFRIKYRENSIDRDSLLGTKHQLKFQTVLNPENLNFSYNRNQIIEIVKRIGNSNSVNLRIPDEIIGKITVRNNKNRNRIFLSWNKSNLSNSLSAGELKEEIIIGGILQDRNELLPLLRLTRLNSNIFEIPNYLLEDIIKSDKFNYLVITLIRKIVSSQSNNELGEINIASQSIHNIWVKI